MKLLLDEQISGRVAVRLRERGRDVVATAEEPGMRGLSDPDLFEAAQAQERAVATYNRPDFEALIREYAEVGREHHGLIIVHPVKLPSSDIGRLADALEALLEAPPPGKSFVVWLQPAPGRA